MKNGARNGGLIITKKLLNCKLYIISRKQNKLQKVLIDRTLESIIMMILKKYLVSYAINSSMTAMNSSFTVRKISITKLLLINLLMNHTIKSLKSWTDRKLHKN
jgi:hypothetical protein